MQNQNKKNDNSKISKYQICSIPTELATPLSTDIEFLVFFTFTHAYKSTILHVMLLNTSLYLCMFIADHYYQYWQ